LSERAILEAVQAKVFETIERTRHLVLLVPRDRLTWRPDLPAGTPSMDLGHVLGHLLDCLAGFCAVFQRAFADQFAELESLRRFVNQSCAPEEAATRIDIFSRHIEQGFQCGTDGDLSRAVPTVFVPQGEPLLTLLLGNLEHLLNHKYQLFVYLKLAGVPVSSQDLYRFQEPTATESA
jgi:uncharacterized damage-inducible protein DinB